MCQALCCMLGINWWAQMCFLTSWSLYLTQCRSSLMLNNALLWDPVLCTPCSSVPSHSMLRRPLLPVMTTKNVFRHCQIALGRYNHPHLRNWSRGNHVASEKGKVEFFPFSYRKWIGKHLLVAAICNQKGNRLILHVAEWKTEITSHSAKIVKT